MLRNRLIVAIILGAALFYFTRGETVAAAKNYFNPSTEAGCSYDRDGKLFLVLTGHTCPKHFRDL